MFGQYIDAFSPVLVIVLVVVVVLVVVIVVVVVVVIVVVVVDDVSICYEKADQGKKTNVLVSRSVERSLSWSRRSVRLFVGW